MGLLAALLLAAAGAPCPGADPALVVSTADHTLWLCDQGKALKSYAVSLGRGGTGKRTQGDLKTPVGTYPISPARPSEKFGLFIPIGYPTAEQRAQGFTGSAIGLHGPSRDFRWAGSLNRLIDWTQGCLAVASDEEIRAIAAFVRHRKPREIHIR